MNQPLTIITRVHSKIGVARTKSQPPAKTDRSHRFARAPGAVAKVANHRKENTK